MSNLQLPLFKKWFDLTKSGEKKEDYREITPYWCNRLLLFNGRPQTKSFWKIEYFVYGTLKERLENIEIFCKFKPFDSNIMTLGYPSKTDTERILTLQHLGIEIREGNLEWGAEKGVVYFVIKHGSINDLDKLSNTF
jgi:gamma-glutamylcyclotransferase (GGCT)/AIG2-like uncharacterized protein YtfP